METKLEMSPAQIYTYLSDYNNSVWDRILSGRSFDDLTDNIRRTGILEDTIGQTVLTAYRQCEPDIPANGGLDGNILFHLLKENALALTDVNFRNFTKEMQKKHDLYYACYMAAASSQTCNMETISSIYRNYIPDHRNTLAITPDELEIRNQFMLLYQEKLEEFYTASRNLTEKHKSRLYPSDEAQNDLLALFQKLYSALCFREEFSISFFADLTIMEESNGNRYYVTEPYEQNSLKSRLASANTAQYSDIIEEWLHKNPDKISEIPFLFRIENLAPNKYTRKSENGVKNFFTVGKNNRYGETDLLSNHIDHLSQSIPVLKTQDSHLRPRKGSIDKINISLIDYNYFSIILLEYFLHLGLPSNALEQFMATFGYSFGSGLKPLCKNHGLYEPYVKYLIDSGISYRAIAFIIENQSSFLN